MVTRVSWLVGWFVDWSSKPTVWDGDKVFLFYELKDRPYRSKPTVWDGDLKVPPFSNPNPKPCSKPTVWDGDIFNLLQKSLILFPF